MAEGDVQDGRCNSAKTGAGRTGPSVGACWAAALITGRAWAWPVPLPARVLPGVALITIIGLLAAALGPRYRLAARAGAAGCIAITVLDIMMITGVALATPAVTWVTIGAMAASATRIAFSALTVHPLLSR